MKLRIIIWSIVGIVVIIGVLFLVLTGKNTRRVRVTLDDLKREAAKIERSINELNGRLAQARAVPLPPEKNAALSQVESHLNQTQKLIENVKNSTDVRTANDALRQAHRLIRKCRRLLREATTPRPARAGPAHPVFVKSC